MASEVDPHRWISWVSLPILWIHCLLVPTLVLAILSVSLVLGIAWVVFGPQESREASMGALMLPAYFLAMPLELVTIGGGFA